MDPASTGGSWAKSGESSKKGIYLWLHRETGREERAKKRGALRSIVRIQKGDKAVNRSENEMRPDLGT